MPFSSLRRFSLPFAILLFLAACHQNMPQAALKKSLQLVKAADFAGYWAQALPPADYANIRADWQQLQQPYRPLSTDQELGFEQFMHKFTMPAAKAQLYRQLQPQLLKIQKKYQSQMPVLIGIVQVVASSGIAKSRLLTPAQKKQVEQVLVDALIPWLRKAQWFDQAKAKQAVGVVVDTVRQLKLKKLDDLHTQNFDISMKRYADLFIGIKKLLAIYGLSVDDVLDSIRFRSAHIKDSKACLKYSYVVLGRTFHGAMQMEKIRDHWYSTALLNDLRKRHQALVQRRATVAAATLGTHHNVPQQSHAGVKSTVKTR